MFIRAYVYSILRTLYCRSFGGQEDGRVTISRKAHLRHRHLLERLRLHVVCQEGVVPFIRAGILASHQHQSGRCHFGSFWNEKRWGIITIDGRRHPTAAHVLRSIYSCVVPSYAGNWMLAACVLIAVRFEVMVQEVAFNFPSSSTLVNPKPDVTTNTSSNVSFKES